MSWFISPDQPRISFGLTIPPDTLQGTIKIKITNEDKSDDGPVGDPVPDCKVTEFYNTATKKCELIPDPQPTCTGTNCPEIEPPRFEEEPIEVVIELIECIILGDQACIEQAKFFPIYMILTVFTGLAVVVGLAQRKSPTPQALSVVG